MSEGDFHLNKLVEDYIEERLITSGCHLTEKALSSYLYFERLLKEDIRSQDKINLREIQHHLRDQPQRRCKNPHRLPLSTKHKSSANRRDRGERRGF